MSILNVTKNTDNLTGGAASDGFVVAGPTSDLSSADTLDGAGSTNAIDFRTAGAVADAQFTNVTHVQEIVLDAKSGSYTLTLGAEATQSGIDFIDAENTGASLTIDASSLLNPLNILAGKGANVITGTVGDDSITIDGASFTSADKVNGGGFGDHDQIIIAGKEIIADSVFANVHNVESLALGEYSGSYSTSGKATLGALSQAAGINEVWDYLGDPGMTLDAGARTVGVTFHGNYGADIFIGSAGNDTFLGSLGDDSYRVKAANLTSADSIDGGAGKDEIRILDAGTLLDSAFNQVTGVERLAFDGTGKQTVTLSSEAQAAGLVQVDAGKVTGGLALDATAMTSGLAVVMGSGADNLQLGGKAGVTNDIFVQSAKLTAADHISGPAAATEILHFTDAVKLTDAYFSGLKSGNIANLSSLDLDNVGKGQSLVAGSNFAGFVQQSDLFTLIATSANSSSSFTFDFSGYNGAAIAIGGTVGSDVFIEGASHCAYIAAAYTSADGNYGGDTIKFASQYLDGQRAVVGTTGAIDKVVVTDAVTAVVDTGFQGMSSIETLQLGASKSANYDVTLGAHAKGAGIDTIDASLAGVTVKLDTTGFAAPLTVIAGAKDNHFQDGAAGATFVFAPATLNAGDVVKGGAGVDSIQLGGPGSVAAAAFGGITGVEKLILSSAGNTVVLSDTIAAGGNAALSFDGQSVDFLVLGAKGNDIVDLSQVSLADYVGVVAGAGTDKLTAAGGKNTFFFFMNPGDLTGADQIKGDKQGSEVIACAGTYKADVFKGMSHIDIFRIDDQAHPNLGSNITVDNNAVKQTGGNGLNVETVGTGDDRIDASAVTDLSKYVDINSGGGNDTLIGPAGGGNFIFNEDGSGGFLLDQNDKITGGNDRGEIRLEDLSGLGATLNDIDLSGVTGIDWLALESSGQVTVNYGSHAESAGIGVIDGQAAGNIDLVASGATHALEVLTSAGGDLLTLGGGDDLIDFNGYASHKLTSADHIDGGAGQNVLQFEGDVTLVDANLAHVSNIQEIVLSGDQDFGGGFGSSLTLGAAADNAGIGKVDATQSVAGISVDASGMSGSLVVQGSHYSDTLIGSDSWNILEGGYGGDKLTGGTGADQFAIHSAADSRQMPGNSVALADLITDFNAGQLDTIHLEGIGLASSTLTERAQGAFVTTTTAGFFGGNDIALQYDGSGETRLYGDVNHNGTYDVGIDLMVRISGNHAHELATSPLLVAS